jgi:site-specific DNA-methyltransferase (adenine-specific)
MATATSSASPEWPTPQWLVDRLAAEFGPFDLDPAATASNAKAPAFYTAEQDGLAQPWKGRVWLNPPYGQYVRRWLAKARAEIACGNADLVVALVAARVDTRWWRESTRSALVRFVPGRLANPDGSQWPFPSAVLVFGTDGRRHGTEAVRCAVCSQWFWPARSDYRACSRRCRRALERDRLGPVTRSGRRRAP